MRLKNRKRKRQLAAAIERGRALLIAGQDEKALEFLEEMVQRFPEDAELRMLYASKLLAFRPDDVAREAAKAVELGPDDPVILVRAGHLLFHRGEVEAAKSCAARANEVADSGFSLEAGLLSLDGRLAAFDGKDNLAEEKLRGAMAEDPDYSTYVCDLARFLVSRGRQAEAIAVIDEALKKCRRKDGLEELRDEIRGAEAG